MHRTGIANGHNPTQAVVRVVMGALRMLMTLWSTGPPLITPYQ